MPKKKKPIYLNLGCGVRLIGSPKVQWINVDAFFTEQQIRNGAKTKEGFCCNAIVEPYAKYEQANILKLPFVDDYADYVLMDNVIEHLPMRLVIPAMQEVRRVMKRKAQVVIITPDFNCLARLWVSNVAEKTGKFHDFGLYHYIAEVIYGNQIGMGEFHCVPMTPDYLNYILKVADFKLQEVRVYPMHGPGMKGIAGVKLNPGAVMRTDNLVAKAIKPEKDEEPKPQDREDAPAPLGINVSETVKTTDKVK